MAWVPHPLTLMPSVWDCFEPTVWRLEWGKKISERRFQFLCAPTVEKREKITLCKISNKLFIYSKTRRRTNISL